MKVEINASSLRNLDELVEKNRKLTVALHKNLDEITSACSKIGIYINENPSGTTDGKNTTNCN